jgi:hypothetical protein
VGLEGLLARLPTADDAAGKAGSHCCVSASLRTKTLGVMLEIRGNMGQCKSKDQDFKE